MKFSQRFLAYGACIFGPRVVFGASAARYCLNSDRLTYQEHVDLAGELGGQLVSIHDEYTNDLVSDMFDRQLYIGYRDVAQEGVWVWSDGFSNDYSSWRPGEPNNDYNNEDCAEIASGLWNDIPCGFNRAAAYIIPACLTERATSMGLNCDYDLPNDQAVHHANLACPAQYCFNSENLDWFEHDQIAAGLGGQLVSIHDEETNELINSFYGDDIWIGYTDLGREGVWIWEDGCNIDYDAWRDGEPNDGGRWRQEDCATANFRNTGEWNDDRCNYRVGAAYIVPLCMKEEAINRGYRCDYDEPNVLHYSCASLECPSTFVNELLLPEAADSQID